MSETSTPSPRLRYRLLTGPDDRSFCEKVSAALDDGYVLHGSPAIAVGPDGPVAAQAVVLPTPLAPGEV
ncbi:DUF1737 domain-containing protein [Kineococcus gynurae]|uniref:DUF1737 domain-containing protein n=1 Tax=Kineococcus gynurae TaxID=452979 RepID=A0ABV5LWW7_9ACTN